MRGDDEFLALREQCIDILVDDRKTDPLSRGEIGAEQPLLRAFECNRELAIDSIERLLDGACQRWLMQQYCHARCILFFVVPKVRIDAFGLTLNDQAR